MSPEAKRHYDRGLDLYARRDFTAAARQFEKSFAIEPRREFLFAEAQASRLAGDCGRAMPLYRRFLQSDPSPLQIEAARLGLDRCAPDRSSPPPVPAAMAPVPPAAKPPAAPPPEPRPVWWRDPWAASSIGLGLAALGMGIGFDAASQRSVDDASSVRTRTYSEYAELWETAQQRHTLAVSSFVVGAALLVAGVARFAFVHRRERAAASGSTGARVSFTSLLGGGLVWYRVPF